MSFPTGVLRWTGNWSSTVSYRYGDIALASTNVSYACGVPTSLNVDPATQPSTDWFGFPPSGGGSPTAWSEFPATQNVIMGDNKIVNDNDGLNSIQVEAPSDHIKIIATKIDTSRIYLTTSTTGAVIVDGPNSLLQVNKLANLNGVSGNGTAGQILTYDGTQILWTDPPQVRGLTLSTPVVVTIPGVTILDLEFTPTIQCQASVTASINYETLAPGADTLTITLKGDVGGTSSIVIDEAVLTAVSLGAKQSCVLSGVLPYTLSANALEQIRLSAVSSGAGSFSINKANVNCIYNILPQS